MENKHRGFKIFLFLLCFSIITLILYISYDRTLTPPPPNWISPTYIPDPPGTPKVVWTRNGDGSTYFLSFLSTHQPNALEHYINALSTATETDYFAEIMDKGWTKDNPDADKELRVNQKAIEEVILGAKMKHCELPPMPYREDAPYLNFLQIRIVADDLVLAARKLEYQKQYSTAADYYLDGIQFAKDLVQKDQSLINHMIGIAIMQMHIQPLLKLISSQKLTQQDYRRIIDDLGQIDQELPPLSDSLIVDYRTEYTIMPNTLRNPKKLFETLSYHYYFNPNIQTEIKDKINAIEPSAYAFFNQGRVLRNFLKYNEELLSAMTTKPYHEFIQIDWEKRIPSDPVSQRIIYAPISAYTKHNLKLTYLRLAQIQSAIHLYCLQKKKWPKSFDDLKPDYLSTLPLDPFIDQPFHFSQDSTGPFAYSVGPDLTDDSAKIIYNPYVTRNDKGDICP